jgi:vacuolar-type H+-ATPase subunit I/STV1
MFTALCAAQAQPVAESDGILDALFAPGAQLQAAGVKEIVFAILFSFVLNSLIALLYKVTYRGTKYSQDYVNTLIILGTVVTMVIMVVHGNKEMAFGMFAAFSIIRFRRTVSQARDIGFIFFAMATGLAIGARQYELALVTVPLVCAVIYVLGAMTIFGSKSGSHVLRIRVGNDLNYDQAFAEPFKQFTLTHELVSAETIQAGMMTELVYEITLQNPSDLNRFTNALQMANGNNRVLITKANDQAAQDSD